MIAVDTNILVYAHRIDFPLHGAAERVLVALAESRARWAIPWPCLHEFIAIVTNSRIFRTATPVEVALSAIQAWLAAPGLSLLSEAEGYWPVLRDQLARGAVTGAKVHDARVAALCLHHGVTELWTADRDFGRFPALKVRNPLVGLAPENGG